MWHGWGRRKIYGGVCVEERERERDHLEEQDLDGNWKTARILSITKPGREDSTDPSKYRPISLINTAGKILEKLLIKRIIHHVYKTEFLSENQDGFTPQTSTVDAAMEAKKFIEPHLEKGRIVILASLDVKGAFDSAWFPAILKGLRDARCPRKLYYLTLDYLKERKAVININNFSIKKKITKGCPQGSCCGPGLWNVQYDPILNLSYTKYTKIIAFADVLVIIVEADSIGEAENFANIELNKIAKWAADNKIKFNEAKSKVMLMSRRKRIERNEIAIYLNNKPIPQVQRLKYLGIIIDRKLIFKDHIN
jgi:hypothetical protein